MVQLNARELFSVSLPDGKDRIEGAEEGVKSKMKEYAVKYTKTPSFSDGYTGFF